MIETSRFFFIFIFFMKIKTCVFTSEIVCIMKKLFLFLSGCMTGEGLKNNKSDWWCQFGGVLSYIFMKNTLYNHVHIKTRTMC